MELIGNTYSQLNRGQVLPPPIPTFSNTASTAIPKTTITTTETSSTTTTSKDVLPWTVNKSNHIGDRVEYVGNLYQCLQAHTSLANWAPTETPALWQRI